MDTAVRGSMWMSFVATPSVKEGLTAAIDSSGREVTPKELVVLLISSVGFSWMRFCKRCLRRNLKNTL